MLTTTYQATFGNPFINFSATLATDADAFLKLLERFKKSKHDWMTAHLHQGTPATVNLTSYYTMSTCH